MWYGIASKLEENKWRLFITYPYNPGGYGMVQLPNQMIGSEGILESRYSSQNIMDYNLLLLYK